MSNGQYPPPPPGASKAGMPGWAKALIGCGCLLLLIGAGVAGFMAWGAKKVYDTVSDPAKMAEFVLSQNPDLEVVENNKDAGTITVRDKKTGETTTFNYADIKDGKFSIEGNDGKTVTVDGSQQGENGQVNITGPNGEKLNFGSGAAENVPSWVPLYGNAKETVSAYNAETNGELTGLVTQTTGDSMAAVKKHYEDLFASEGYKIVNSFSGGSGDQQGVILNAEKGNITIALAIGSNGSDTTVNVTYKGPK